MKLQVKNAYYSYPSQPDTLQDISFTVEQGEVLSVLGPNGVGKTTLLRCLAGFLKWKQGEEWIDDVPASSIPQAEFWKKAAYVPQARSMTFPYLTEETVLLGRNPYLSIFAQPSKKDRQIAMDAMEECGIAHLKGKRCDEISGGELQLVLIARALTQQPQLLIMDEPETGLDFKNQLMVLTLIEKLSEQNHISVIFNTHYPDHALRISDHTLLLMRNGRCLFGETETILNEENMKAAFDVNIHTFKEEIDGVRCCAIVPLPMERDNANDQ